MQWGIEHEEDALMKEYAFIYDTEVISCGFIQHPKIEMAGTSPDGFVDDDGLVEVKCPQANTHLRFFIDNQIKPEYSAQMQFQMACTGRKWCDFISYNPHFVGKSLLRGNRARDGKDLDESCMKLWECFFLPALPPFRTRKLNVPDIKHIILPSAKDEKFCFLPLAMRGNLSKIILIISWKIISRFYVMFVKIQ
ncbi:hypothetical protein MCY_01455 [Bartonella rattimassiliensis 15908]|uniref:YqaJ viral recombinase domain-containing protein n=1 Tax=Bartonella rattimassiliensis 15908 TaxID=1094556 RepID=J0QJ53_9HYPH|nr:hypothetical protein MCY_01455 [Bartonella rattimassiliensis 15908]